MVAFPRRVTGVFYFFHQVISQSTCIAGMGFVVGALFMASFASAQSHSAGALIEKLKSAHDDLEKERIVRTYGKHNGDVLGVLIASLQSEDVVVRATAVYALGVLGDHKALPALTKLLSDKSRGVRANIAEALGKIGDDLSVRPLIFALKDEFWRVRANAAEALGRIKNPQAIVALAKVLGSKAGDVHYGSADPASKAIDALANIEDMRAVNVLVGYLYTKGRHKNTAILALGRTRNSKVIAPLLRFLGSRDWKVRYHVVVALGNFRNEKVLGLLIARLRDSHENVRVAAVRELASFKDRKALEAILRALRDHDSVHSTRKRVQGDSDDTRDVRVAAARVLGRVQGKQAVEALISALKDRSSLVRAAALEALLKMQAPKAQEAAREYKRAIAQ